MPLAPGMKDKLIRRDEIDLPNKKANEYNIRKYIKRQLNEIEEILWVLDQLPESQLDKLFSAKDITRLQKLEEKIIKHVDIHPVEGDKIVYRVNVKGDIAGLKNATNIIKVILPAQADEIELAAHIPKHADIVTDSLKAASRKDPRVYSLKEFNNIVLRDIAKTATARGQGYHVEFESAAAWIEDEKEESK
jgi:hypothetical protein